MGLFETSGLGSSLASLVPVIPRLHSNLHAEDLTGTSEANDEAQSTRFEKAPDCRLLRQFQRYIFLAILNHLTCGIFLGKQHFLEPTSHAACFR